MSLALMSDRPRLSILARNRLKNVVARLVLAEVAYSWKGCKTPEEVPHIEAEKTKANKAFEKLLKDL